PTFCLTVNAEPKSNTPTATTRSKGSEMANSRISAPWFPESKARMGDIGGWKNGGIESDPSRNMPPSNTLILLPSLRLRRHDDACSDRSERGWAARDTV